MIYIAVALEDNEAFTVKKDQVVAVVDLNDELFINPETAEFDQEMFDAYFPTAVSSSPEGALAEVIGCVWSQKEKHGDAEPIAPIIVNDDII